MTTLVVVGHGSGPESPADSRVTLGKTTADEAREADLMVIVTAHNDTGHRLDGLTVAYL